MSPTLGCVLILTSRRNELLIEELARHHNLILRSAPRFFLFSSFELPKHRLNPGHLEQFISPPRRVASLQRRLLHVAREHKVSAESNFCFCQGRSRFS